MKKYQLLLLILFISLTCVAQSEKGNWQVGIGGLPIIYFDKSELTGYSLRANISYFIVNRFSVGLLPFMGKVDDMKAAGANLSLRYYIINSKLSLFAEFSIGFGSLKYENSPQFNGTMNSIIVGPGAHYSFNNNLCIEVLLQYARLRNITYPESTVIGNTFIPTIGLQYFITK